jgi:hypothetical protein
MIASSGGIVQSTSPGHQNLRSLSASPVHGTRHGSPGSPTAPPASRTDWGLAGRLIRPRLADLVSPRARSGAAAAGQCRGSPGHVRQCPGDFRGRLLRQGGSTRRARCWFLSSPPACRMAWRLSRRAGLRDTFGSVRETSAEDCCAAVAHPPGSLQISLATGILAVWHGLRGGCWARAFGRWRRVSIPPTGDRRGWAGAWRLTWMSAPPRDPASAVLLPRVRRCSDRRNDREQNGREDRGSKQDAYAVHGKLLASPGRSTCPPIVIACKWVRRCSNPAEISALLLIRDGLWSVGVSALHPLGEGDHTSRMPSHHPLALAAP